MANNKKQTATLAGKYISLRQKTEDQLSAEQLQYDVEDNKSQLEADLKVTQRQLAAERRTLEQLKSAKVLSSKKLIDQLDLIEGLEKGVESLEALIEELF